MAARPRTLAVRGAGIFLLPALSEAWGQAPVMVAVAAVSGLGFLITALFGGGW